MSTKRALSWLRTGWNLFVDPGRESRLEELTASLHRELATLKGSFKFNEAADRLDISPDDYPDIRNRLLRRCVGRAWSDGELTDREARSLRWIAEVLGFSEEQANSVIREHAIGVFSSKMAAAFSDGELDDAEYADLQRIAETCGESAASFFQHQFRDDGEGFLRQLFLNVWEDGKMDESEWESIKTTMRRLGMTDAELREVISVPARQLVEHYLTDYKSDEEITPDEEQTLEWMLTHLIDDRTFERYVRREIRRGKEIASIRRGILPSVQAPMGIALKAGEITHFSTACMFSYTKQRRSERITEAVAGLGVVTDNRFVFISAERSLQIGHNSILGYKRRRSGIDIQTSGKGVGHYEFEEDNDIGREIWIAAIDKANQTLIAPQVKNDVRKIAREVRQRVWQKYGGQCAECGAKQYLEFDHIIPVARGGGNSENNIQLLCRGCNNKKSDSI